MNKLSPVLDNKVIQRLRKIRHVALDMDGTVYMDKILFKTTLPFLDILKKLGITHTFLTNNPSKSAAEYLSHLKSIGIQATTEELYTSAHATIDFLKSKFPQIHRIF